MAMEATCSMAADAFVAIAVRASGQAMGATVSGICGASSAASASFMGGTICASSNGTYATTASASAEAVTVDGVCTKTAHVRIRSIWYVGVSAIGGPISRIPCNGQEVSDAARGWPAAFSGTMAAATWDGRMASRASCFRASISRPNVRSFISPLKSRYAFSSAVCATCVAYFTTFMSAFRHGHSRSVSAILGCRGTASCNAIRRGLPLNLAIVGVGNVGMRAASSGMAVRPTRGVGGRASCMRGC